MADDIFKNLPPEARAALESAREKLKQNQVAIKDDSRGPQHPPRQPEHVRSTDPGEPFARNGEAPQRGVDKIRQAQAQAQQPKAPEQTQEKTQEPER